MTVLAAPSNSGSAGPRPLSPLNPSRQASLGATATAPPRHEARCSGVSQRARLRVSLTGQPSLDLGSRSDSEARRARRLATGLVVRARKERRACVIQRRAQLGLMDVGVVERAVATVTEKIVQRLDPCRLRVARTLDQRGDFMQLRTHRGDAVLEQ